MSGAPRACFLITASGEKGGGEGFSLTKQSSRHSLRAVARKCGKRPLQCRSCDIFNSADRSCIVEKEPRVSREACSYRPCLPRTGGAGVFYTRPFVSSCDQPLPAAFS